MSNDLKDRLLTAAEAGRFLGYSESTIRNKASLGEIPFVKLGTALRFRLSELESWVEQLDAESKRLLEEQRAAALRGAA